VAEAYANGHLDHFRSHLRTALTGRVAEWTGTDVTRFTRALREFNRKAQTGLKKIDQLANEDISHAWPAVKEMWAWRNQKLKDRNSIMNCYVGKLQ
jgi:hypothetical protein